MKIPTANNCILTFEAQPPKSKIRVHNLRTKIYTPWKERS